MKEKKGWKNIFSREYKENTKEEEPPLDEILGTY